jgi:hypothetical protein
MFHREASGKAIKPAVHLSRREILLTGLRFLNTNETSPLAVISPRKLLLGATERTLPAFCFIFSSESVPVHNIASQKDEEN